MVGRPIGDMLADAKVYNDDVIRPLDRPISTAAGVAILRVLVLPGLIFGANINEGITLMSFIYSLVGAVILLAIVNLVRRGSVR